MPNKHMKKYPTAGAIRETGTQTTIRYHYTPIRMAKIETANTLTLIKPG